MPNSIKIALNNDTGIVTSSSQAARPYVLEFDTPPTSASGSSATLSLGRLGWVPLLVHVQVSFDSGGERYLDCDFYFSRGDLKHDEYHLLGTSDTRSYIVEVKESTDGIDARLVGASDDYKITGMWGYNYVRLMSHSTSTILTNSSGTAILPFYGPGATNLSSYKRRCYISVPLPQFSSSVQFSVDPDNTYCIEEVSHGDLSPNIVLGVAMADWNSGSYSTNINLLTDADQDDVLRQNSSTLLAGFGIERDDQGITWAPNNYALLFAADGTVGGVHMKFSLSDGNWNSSNDVNKSIINGVYGYGAPSLSYFFAITFDKWAYWNGSIITRS